MPSPEPTVYSITDVLSCGRDGGENSIPTVEKFNSGWKKWNSGKEKWEPWSSFATSGITKKFSRYIVNKNKFLTLSVYVFPNL